MYVFFFFLHKQLNLETFCSFCFVLFCFVYQEENLLVHLRQRRKRRRKRRSISMLNAKTTSAKLKLLENESILRNQEYNSYSYQLLKENE